MNMITSRDNPNIKEIIKLQKSAKQRRDAGLFTVEGVRLCRDAALSGAKINKLVYTKQAMEKYSDDFKLISDSGCEKIEVSADIFLKISDTKSPQGLLCVISMLDKSILVDKIENIRRRYNSPRAHKHCRHNNSRRFLHTILHKKHLSRFSIISHMSW